MKISRNVLSRFTPLPEHTRELRELLDDVGIEVKRVEASDDDVVLTLELLANRGDHHCYHGIARELHGRTGRGLERPELAELPVGESPVRLVSETELCLCYTATRLELDRAPESLPPQVLAPITAMGIHSISPAVDATNLANHELGQPTHVFDADTIVGGITIRLSREGEQAWPLFAEEKVTLPEGTIVIADDVKVLAIAGVIGCEESKTTAESRNLLVESATFDPVSVRKTARALNIRTDSSVRFERGGDPSAPLLGAGRVVWLLESVGAVRVGQTGVVGSWTDPRRTIDLDVAHAREFLAIELSRDQAAARLRRYGFAATPQSGDLLHVRVPPHRLWDVEHTSDLLEELAKSVGYNEIPSTLPPIDMGSVPSRREQIKRQVEEVLLGQGFYEVFTDGFHGTDTRDLLGLPEGHPLLEHVTTLNALERGYSLLKNNGFAQLVQGVAQNVRHQHRQVRAYEWTRTFHLDESAENGLCSERAILAVVANGEELPQNWAGHTRAFDVHAMAGLVRELGIALGLPLVLAPLEDGGHVLADVLHPGRRALITVDGETVGVLGEAHPRVVQNAGLKKLRPVYLEILREGLEAPGVPVVFEEPPAMPPVTRNLAFTLPHGVPSGAVTAVLHEAGPDWLVGTDIVDSYHHEEDGAPVHTLTWALTWAHGENTRTADEINGATEALVQAIGQSLGDQGVKLR